ncbi:MAG TPA: ferrous iron transport protein B [Blastocatellia bacterium]|nr:ferrous iron transport protein B [Blastocatellia bacterium]
MNSSISSTITQVSPPTSSAPRQLTVALAGNPNAGKTSLFNALTGMRQKVANYPGVTVERKEGCWTLSPELPGARLIDLPGLYSLDAASLDEQIARDVLVGGVEDVARPDVIVVAVDATNLERNLYLVTQLLEYGRPVIIALTMIDLTEKMGVAIDAEKLSVGLGVPVIPVVAKQKRGIDKLSSAVIKAANSEGPGCSFRLSKEVEQEIEALAALDSGDREAAARDLFTDHLPSETTRRNAVKAARERLAEINPHWWQEPMIARYKWIERVVEDALDKKGEAKLSSATNRIDAVITHKILGPVILVAVMLLVFQTIFSWSRVPMDLIDHGFASLGGLIRAHMAPGLLVDLLVDGVIAGVGGVMVFLPQILLLFLFISILEDSGYMARAAVIMDRLMRGVGLHGKAFMPLLSSFACAIPGIMSTRTIENPKDRLATIMIAPFMSCSARLPVYTLMIAAFFSTQKVFGFLSVGALIIMGMYLLGISVAIVVAFILKRTILKAPPPPFVMELPPYRVPGLVNVGHTMLTRAGLFVKRAGTVIMAISILLWALAAFPRSGQTTSADADPSQGANESAERIQHSYAGQIGRLIEPAIKPLGFDWKIGIGLISSFAARETLVSTLSIVYNVGPSESKEASTSLIAAVRDAKRPDGTPAWTPLVALSLMVFFVLACQCMSTVAVVRRETNSWRWPLFMIGYMLVLAYLGSLITYQGGHLLGFG